MDIYFFSTIANIFWQIFTVLFVLYRFTSFFSIIYNFLKFTSKIFKGFIYVKDQISIYFTKQQVQLENRPKTFFQSIYSYLFPNSQSTQDIQETLPLYETRISFANDFNLDTEVNFENLIENDSDISENDFYIKRKSQYTDTDTERFYFQQSCENYNQKNYNSSTNSSTNSSIDTLMSSTPKHKPFNVENSDILLNQSFINKTLRKNSYYQDVLSTEILLDQSSINII